MGPFGGERDPQDTLRYKSSWYKDYAYFIDSSYPWFGRGGDWADGVTAGIFAFYRFPGSNSDHSFRVVLVS